MSQAPALNPYLFFFGECQTAMQFYQDVLGGDLEIMKFSDAPIESPPEQKDQIMHATLKAGSIVIMASDGMGQFGDSNPGNMVSLSITEDNHERAAEIFAKLSAGGEVMMPFEKQFWGDVFGHCTDRFGISWMVNCLTSQD